MAVNALEAVQSVLVLGATSDIAQAVTRRLVDRGAEQVVLAGRDEEACRAVAAALPADVTTVVLGFDACDVAAHDDLVDRVFALGFDIDAVLVAFGVQPPQMQVEAEPDVAVVMAQVNYVGAVSLLLRITPRLQDQGHGRIVVLSSVAGERARRSNFAYGSTKAGLDAFSQGLADSLHGSGVGVTVVRPGFVRSSLTADMPEAPLAVNPDDVADAVVRALERGQGTVWVPAVLRWVMVILRHLPRAVFRRLPI